MKKKEHYIYGIDAIRLLAALLVAVFHLTYQHSQGTYLIPFGWIGVQVFFVISGLVIANSASHANPGDFLVGRLLRLYPAAWIAAAINGLLLLWIPRSVYQSLGINVVPQLGAFLRSTILVGDYFMASAYWTLPIELAFYALVFFSLSFNGKPRLRLIARLLTVTSIPYLVMLYLHDSRLASLAWVDHEHGVKGLFLLRYGHYFALGIFIWLRKEHQRLGAFDRLTVLLALLMACLEIHTKCMEVMDTYLSNSAHLTLFTLYVTAISLFLVLAFIINLMVQHNEQILFPVRVKAGLRIAGLITYPFYLIHEVVGGFIFSLLISLGLPSLLQVAIALIGTGAVAFVVARWGETALRQQLKPLAHHVLLKLRLRTPTRA